LVLSEYYTRKTDRAVGGGRGLGAVFCHFFRHLFVAFVGELNSIPAGTRGREELEENKSQLLNHFLRSHYIKSRLEIIVFPSSDSYYIVYFIVCHIE
jgi:hypothetical protein